MRNELQSEHKLLQAIVKMNSEAVTEILESGADPNFETKYGFHPLHYAIKHGSNSVLRILLEHGADPNQPDGYGNPPLLTAVQAEISDAIFRCDVYGECAKPFVTKLQILLEYGAKPADSEEPGDLIEYTRRHGHVEAVELLIANGALERQKHLDINCLICTRNLSVVINGNYDPPLETVKENGGFSVPGVGWFCSQDCGNKCETQRSVRFYRNEQGLIDYD